MKSRFWLKALGGLVIVLLLAEMCLRLIGFGTIPLYESSMYYDYALQANQEIRRFGRHMFINEEGMRSKPLAEGEFRILKFGDSVLNGGIATDQSDLSSSILERELQELNLSARVLHVSAGSWGPDNAYAWMQAHGDFQAKCIVLLFSSHDWQDQISCEDVVGNIPFYPDHQPLTALGDAFDWVWARTLQHVDWNHITALEGCTPNSAPFNSGWPDFIAYGLENDVPIVVYHHATAEEAAANSLNEMGQELKNYLTSREVIYISGLEAGLEAVDYRDAIHPNEGGQEKIAKRLYPVLLKQLDAVE